MRIVLFFHLTVSILLLQSCGGVPSKRVQAHNNDTISVTEIKADTIIYDTTNFKTMKSQEKYTIIKRFDIQRFNKHNTYDRYEFVDKDGMIVMQEHSISEANGETYIDEHHYPNSPYLYSCVYDPEGRIKVSLTEFYGMSIGKLYNYDPSGNVVKEIDEDAAYKFSIDDLILKMKREYDIDIEDIRYCNSVSRYYSEKLNKPIYVLRILNDDSGKYIGYVIDGNNGKTLFSIERFMNDKMGSIEDNYIETLKKK